MINHIILRYISWISVLSPPANDDRASVVSVTSTIREANRVECMFKCELDMYNYHLQTLGAKWYNTKGVAISNLYVNTRVISSLKSTNINKQNYPDVYPLSRCINFRKKYNFIIIFQHRLGTGIWNHSSWKTCIVNIVEDTLFRYIMVLDNY